MSDTELRSLDHEIAQAPDAADLHERRGRLLLRMGRAIEGVSALDLALRLGSKRLLDEVKRLLDGLAIRDERVNATFRLIPGGPAIMGADDGDDDEKPLHLVRLDPFYVAADVVQVHYTDNNVGNAIAVREVAEKTFHGAGFYAERPRKNLTPFSIDHRHVLTYLETLTGLSGIKHRLLTEAEWERTCRGVSAGLPYGVAIGEPWEFVADLYDSAAYDGERDARGTRVNPRGRMKTGEHRVVRGAHPSNDNVPFVRRPSWRDSASDARELPDDGLMREKDRTGGPPISFRLVRPVTA